MSQASIGLVLGNGMAIERRWLAVAPVAFTAQGTSRGKVTVSSTRGFKVKQTVVIVHPSLGRHVLEVKRVTGRYTLTVGPHGKLDDYSDLSAFDTTSIIYADEQRKSLPSDNEIELAVYDQEPTVAYRTVAVDQWGDYVDETNPLPVELTNSVANLSVQLTHLDNSPNPGDVHDSVRIGDGTNEVSVNNDGSINVNIVESVSVSTPGLTINHQESSTVPAGVETTLITLVAPPTGLRITKICVSGENWAIFRAKIDGQTISLKRTNATFLNAEMVFDDVRRGLLLTSGQILTVTVLHSRPNASDFEATVMSQ